MSEGIEGLIRTRAYERWQQEGRPEGRDKEHWLAAERELASEGVEEGSDTAPTTAEAPSSPAPKRAARPSRERGGEPARKHAKAPARSKRPTERAEQTKSGAES